MIKTKSTPEKRGGGNTAITWRPEKVRTGSQDKNKREVRKLKEQHSKAERALKHQVLSSGLLQPEPKHNTYWVSSFVSGFHVFQEYKIGAGV